MKPIEVRSQLVEALGLDLVGPGHEESDAELREEVLSQDPSRWYLTGFLVPTGAAEAQRSDETADDEFTLTGGESDAADDAAVPEPPAARRAYFPSSIGVSLLVPAGCHRLTVTARWGDYQVVPLEGAQGRRPDAPARRRPLHARDPGPRPLPLEARPARGDARARDPEVLEPTDRAGRPRQRRPEARPLGPARPGAGDRRGDGPRGDPLGLRSSWSTTASRPPTRSATSAFAFQAELEVRCRRAVRPPAQPARPGDRRLGRARRRPAVPRRLRVRRRPRRLDPRRTSTTTAHCRTVRTCWIPSAEVERVAPAADRGRRAGDGGAGRSCRRRRGHGAGSAAARDAVPRLDRGPARPTSRRSPPSAREIGRASCSSRAGVGREPDRGRHRPARRPAGASRPSGIANRVMATAARRRFGTMQGKDPAVGRPARRGGRSSSPSS